MNYEDYLTLSEDRIRQAAENEVAKIREKAAAMSIGEQGDCDLCGARSGRLVMGACAPCRDRYKLR